MIETIEGLSLAIVIIGYLAAIAVTGAVAFLVCYGISIFVLDTWEAYRRQR